MNPSSKVKYVQPELRKENMEADDSENRKIFFCENRKQKMFSGGQVVSVLATTLTIRVRIPLKSTIFL